MIHIPLTGHAPGYGWNQPGATVATDDDGNIRLDIDGEGPDDEGGASRVLTAEEARALAAALWHYADEVER